MNRVFLMLVIVFSLVCFVGESVDARKYCFTLLEPAPIPNKVLSYTDSLITVSFNFPTIYNVYYGFEINLLNNSSRNIKIDWDNSVYIDDNNFSHRIIHGSISTINKEAPQTLSIVIAGSRFTDILISADHIDNLTNYDFFSDNSEGKTINLILSFKIDDRQVNYTFKFQIDKCPKKPKKSDK